MRVGVLVFLCAASAMAQCVLFRVDSVSTNGGRSVYFAEVNNFSVTEVDTNKSCSIINVGLSGSLIPTSTNATIGTIDNPVAAVYTSSNSLWIGGAHIKQHGSGIIVPRIEIESDGFVSKGRGKVKSADIEITDPYRGIIRCTTNGTGDLIKWGEVLTDNGDDTASLDLIRLTFSPEMPFSNRVAAIKQKQNSKRNLRGQIQAGLKANPNSVPALRAIVWQMAEYLNMDPDDS